MSAPPASNGVFVVIPPSNASGLRPPPAILPPSLCQPPGIVQFEEPPLGAQAPRATQQPDLRPVETFLTGEPKALGVRAAEDLGRRGRAGIRAHLGGAEAVVRYLGRPGPCTRETRTLSFPAQLPESKPGSKDSRLTRMTGWGGATPATPQCQVGGSGGKI